jgi:hypothetical protein
MEHRRTIHYVHGVLIASQERQAQPTFHVGSPAELAELGWLE